MADKSYDVVVIGGGPGGYVCAIRAAQLGQKVAVVERENLGGICLNWGCIPTKALLKSSELFHTLKHDAASYGLSVKGVDFDLSKIVARSRGVSDKLSKGVAFLMKKNKIDVLEGSAKFSAPRTLTITKGKTETTVDAKNIVVATGARAREVKGVLESNGSNIWTYREALVPEKLPKSLLVIGAGAIGVEFASFYNALGTDVTIVEAQDRVVPVEDAEVSKILAKSFTARGIKLHTQSKVLGLKASKTEVEASLEIGGKAEKKKFEKVLIAIGVVGNTEDMGLENLGVRLKNGHVEVDALYRTGAPGVWAIGDVVGAPWLAHVASHEGVICAEAIAGKNPHPMRYDNIPGCTYCTPQIGSVGFTEAKAKEAGREIKVGRYNYQTNGKALASGETEGLVKTIIDAKTGELLGAHIIGAEATEMVSTFVLGRHLETTAEAFAEACLPHPTLGEMMGESILDSMGRVLNA